MSDSAKIDRRPSPHREADPFDGIRRLVGSIGAEIEALKQEREADHVRSARLHLGAAHARARLERRSPATS